MKKLFKLLFGVFFFGVLNKLSVWLSVLFWYNEVDCLVIWLLYCVVSVVFVRCLMFVILIL